MNICESPFKKAENSCKTVILLNSFSLKHLSMATRNFWSCCSQSLAVLFLFMEVRYRVSKKRSKNFIEYFSHGKNGMAKCVSIQMFFFQLFQILSYSEIKKLWYIVNNLSK